MLSIESYPSIPEQILSYLTLTKLSPSSTAIPYLVGTTLPYHFPKACLWNASPDTEIQALRLSVQVGQHPISITSDFAFSKSCAIFPLSSEIQGTWWFWYTRKCHGSAPFSSESVDGTGENLQALNVFPLLLFPSWKSATSTCCDFTSVSLRVFYLKDIKSALQCILCYLVLL